MTEIDTSPLVLYGRRRSVARLRAGVLLLETGGARHRIPVAAIGRVEVSGAKGRVLTVVLAADLVTYSLTSRSAPAVRPGIDPGYVILGALVLAYVLVAVVLVVRGAGEDAVVCWLVGPMLVGVGGAALAGGVRTVRGAVVLRRRGITVEGRRKRSYEVGTGEDAVMHHTYEYVDALGSTRTRSGREGGSDEVDILYDPEDLGVGAVGLFR